jgi:hypothetical protein
MYLKTQSEAISMIHSVKMMSKELQHQGKFQAQTNNGHCVLFFKINFKKEIGKIQCARPTMYHHYRKQSTSN